MPDLAALLVLTAKDSAIHRSHNQGSAGAPIPTRRTRFHICPKRMQKRHETTQKQSARTRLVLKNARSYYL